MLIVLILTAVGACCLLAQGLRLWRAIPSSNQDFLFLE